MKSFLGMVLVVAACAHDVPQDSQTGKDGRIKGAVPIKLDNGEGVAKGIVTYPGGDRVDWRSIDLPQGKHGTLALEMTYTTPRPGLRVTFDLFDGFNQPLAVEKAVAHSRSAKVEHAAGKYFVRVFAPRRGDAGTYKLKASFTDDPIIAPPPQVVVMDPPHLPAVPVAVEECVVFDPKNDDCGTKCPDDAPKNWKGCKNTACHVVDANDPTCWNVMACPVGAPDARIRDCMTGDPIKKGWPVCVDASPDPNNPRCKPTPFTSRIIKVEDAGTGPDDYLITIAIGTEKKPFLDKSWRVQLLQGNTGTPLVGGEAKIIRVEKQQMLAKVHAKRSVIEANQDLKLSPP
ncbi:MAG: hypothetical protein QM831_02285 [Kofleriaceae bacterium]